MTIGAMYGTMFSALVAMMRVRGPIVVAAGVMWGGLVFVISSWIGLPIAASVQQR